MKYQYVTSFTLASCAVILNGCLAGQNQQFFSSDPVSNSALSTSTNTTTNIASSGSATPIATPNVPCTAATTTQNLRVMFMIDNSGSTLTTDPSHYYRVKTIQDFLVKYGSHANLTYSFGYFSGVSAYEYNGIAHNFGASGANAFGSSTMLSSALTLYKATGPGGNTPYVAAFQSLENIVQADEAAGTKQNYVLVFMSDGLPSDFEFTQAAINAGTGQLVDDLRATVQANHTSLLTVSTVYFGAPDSTDFPTATLSTMAQRGNGQFVNTNLLTNELQINDVITVPGDCH